MITDGVGAGPEGERALGVELGLGPNPLEAMPWRLLPLIVE
ncbi:unannotated protein [freshwater metagenome]|uniref:Unannotated protein n=1 Tax=freshwater metagenome TaxID=449393 RepID=A0A6J6XB91_9ZZZZ